jgi:hypothetical protein
LRSFIKQLIFKDVLIDVNDNTLVEMGITLAGDRLRIMQAIEKLKKESLSSGTHSLMHS